MFIYPEHDPASLPKEPTVTHSHPPSCCNTGHSMGKKSCGLREPSRYRGDGV